MEAVHYRPRTDNHNVRCLNGSAHIKRTTDITKVTCEKCKDEATYREYWNKAEMEAGMNWKQKQEYFGF